jgi:hypothetical protein
MNARGPRWPRQAPARRIAGVRHAAACTHCVRIKAARGGIVSPSSLLGRPAQGDSSMVKAMKKQRKHSAAQADMGEAHPLLGRARLIARCLDVAAALLCGWLILDPVPYRLALGLNVALPWLALAVLWCWPQLFAIDNPGDNTRRADLAFVVLFPGVGLLWHALIVANVVNWGYLLIPALIGGALMAGVAGLASPRLRKSPGALPVHALGLSLYAGAMAIIANGLFDDAAPQVIVQPILAKRLDAGVHASSHYFKLGPWGPYAEPNEIEVGFKLYDAKKAGDMVCIYLYPGALGLAWYAVGACRPGSMP